MSENILEIRDLAVEFLSGEQRQRVVEGVSFDIRQGETLALVGESGSGKSVTAHSILRLLPYSVASHPAGSIHYQGEDLLKLPERRLRGIRGNRIAMDQALGRELELARRNLQPLSVLMLDIDHFKRVNDHYGHAVGDEALKAVAETIKDHLRNVDMVFRFGGEEFLVLLSSTPLQAACMVGERLRQAVEELDYRHAGEPLKLSISLGCADLRPGEGSDDLLRRVDEALYEAKRDGRNRLRCA
ncbi:MAG: diguanylate cyclase [Pseudomonas aeruginosa]|nr:diguanylate cyclase [Pseudomonas aeruginosa]